MGNAAEEDIIAKTKLGLYQEILVKDMESIQASNKSIFGIDRFGTFSMGRDHAKTLLGSV